ncbi:hypothetical protein F4809DRAFT_353389 [Biscogniauxia mediterranea]|nr:hypothetical protein F4809DRAFT_353389 [Biscogniauxia mediterranea]
MDEQLYHLAPSVRFARLARQLLVRDDEDYAKCHPSPNIDLCEKTGISSHSAEIAIGVICFLVVGATLTTLTIFHLRRQRMDAKEWPKNNQELADYGIEVPEPINKPKNTYQQPSSAGAGGKSSRNSLDNLARSLRNHDGPGQPGRRDHDYNYKRQRDDDISANMKPVEPASQL